MRVEGVAVVVQGRRHLAMLEGPTDVIPWRANRRDPRLRWTA